MMKIIVRVPENTVPFMLGERYMICEYNGKIQRSIEFFKTWEDVLKYEHIAECVDYTKKLKVVAV